VSEYELLGNTDPLAVAKYPDIREALVAMDDGPSFVLRVMSSRPVATTKSLATAWDTSRLMAIVATKGASSL